MAYGMSDRKRNPPRPVEPDQEQSERFKRAAEEAGVELDEEQLKRAPRKMKERPTEKSDEGEGE